VRNVGRSEAEDMSDQQEDDPMMVDEDVRGRIKPNGRPSATLRCCQTSHEFRKFSLWTFTGVFDKHTLIDAFLSFGSLTSLSSTVWDEQKDNLKLSPSRFWRRIVRNKTCFVDSVRNSYRILYVEHELKDFQALRKVRGHPGWDCLTG
jgi:hypothetical protein